MYMAVTLPKLLHVEINTTLIGLRVAVRPPVPLQGTFATFVACGSKAVWDGDVEVDWK